MGGLGTEESCFLTTTSTTSTSTSSTSTSIIACSSANSYTLGYDKTDCDYAGYDTGQTCRIGMRIYANICTMCGICYPVSQCCGSVITGCSGTTYSYCAPAGCNIGGSC
jgi:hypothetical protein